MGRWARLPNHPFSDRAERGTFAHVLGVEARPRGAAAGFRHQALIYDDDDRFFAGVSGFVTAAVDANEPVAVVVAASKIDRLRRELGREGDQVQYADMTEVGSNPARIIPVWRDFVDGHPTAARLRGVGEPMWAGRSHAEMAECQLHESLLNVAFAGVSDFHLVCPYDASALDPETIALAEHTHPTMERDGHLEPSTAYDGPSGALGLFTTPLPRPDADVDELRFTLGPLHDVRRFVADAARRAGLTGERVDDVVLAANEIASNSVLHGGGAGVIRTWQLRDTFLCEVRDAGQIGDPLVGRVRPRREEMNGRGVWMANELCDLVQVRSPATGTVVRLHMRVSPRT